MNVDFNFKVDKRLLLYFMITHMRYFKNDLGIWKIVNSFFEKFPYTFKKIQRIYITKFLSGKLKKLDYEIMDEVTKTEEFQKYYIEALDNFERIKANWEAKKESINQYLTDVLRINVESKTDVYILPPSMSDGRTIDSSFIIWGHRNGLTNPDYDLTYLVHEYLHTLFKKNDRKYKKHYDMVHAVIELISDEGLYLKLNGSKKLEGHSMLDIHREKVSPLFEQYLQTPNMNIEQFFRVTLNNRELMTPEVRGVTK